MGTVIGPDSNYKVCEHIKDDGVRCGSPALRGKEFCYYHFRIYETPFLPGEQDYRPPVLDSQHGIQLMLNHALHAYMLRTINHREMANIIQALRLATKLERDVFAYTPMQSTEFTPAMVDVLRLPKNCVPVGDPKPKFPETAEEAIAESNALIAPYAAELEMMFGKKKKG